jgi:hypothetical protein
LRDLHLFFTVVQRESMAGSTAQRHPAGGVIGRPDGGRNRVRPRDNRRRDPPADHETISYPGVVLRIEVFGIVGVTPELPSLDQRRIDFAMFRQSTPPAGQRAMDELHLEALFNDRLVAVAGRHRAYITTLAKSSMHLHAQRFTLALPVDLPTRPGPVMIAAPWWRAPTHAPAELQSRFTRRQ